MHHPDVHKIEEHMQVVDEDGVPIGMVDGLEEGLIKLTRNSGGGVHRFVPPGLVHHVRGGVVMLRGKVADIGDQITQDPSGAERSQPHPQAGGLGHAHQMGMSGGQRQTEEE